MFGAGGVFVATALFHLLIVAAVTVLLIVGVRESARANAILVLLKLAMIALFVIVGVGHIDPVNWHPFAPNGFRGIMTGAALIFFAYIGFDAVSTTAEETRNPQRDLPIGMIASLVVCTILYIGVTVVLTGMLPTSRLATAEPVAVALPARVPVRLGLPLPLGRRHRPLPGVAPEAVRRVPHDAG